MKIYRGIAGILCFSAMLSSCGLKEEPEKIVDRKPQVSKIMPPFRYHKAIEVKPGLTLDVVSWGRGSESVGGYLILRSDSTNMGYRSVAGELDGEIVDVWDMDLDSDGNPELYIQSEGKGEGSYLNMYIYEYSRSGSSERIRFPELSSSMKKGYMGGDSIYIKEGKLMRDFALYTKTDSATKPTGETRRLEYSLRSNSLRTTEID